jgi:hypothetical protein
VAVLFPAAHSCADQQLGRLAFARPPALSLDMPVPVVQGAGSIAFLSGCGGVAFGGVAEPAQDERILALSYAPDYPDGLRLRVIIACENGEVTTVSARLPDWQLVPIARFAASPQHACFTLFGRLKDPQEQRRREARGEHVMNYHPALENTLLGLRVFQADILLLDPNACDLPREGETYLLGAGESPPAYVANEDRWLRVNQALRGEGEAAQPFRSYLICDLERPVHFSISGGELRITGCPIWYCWKYRSDDPVFLDEWQRRANEEANRVLRERQRADLAALSREEFRRLYTEEHLRSIFDPVFDRVISEGILQPLPDLSKRVTALIEENDGINPPVYEAVVNLMRYAAFFRRYASVDSVGFAEFVAETAAITIEPCVETPTVMIPEPGPHIIRR